MSKYIKVMTSSRYLNGALFLLILFTLANFTTAATPNPGHPWTEVGDGLIQFTAPSALRTYTFPDTNATLLTTLPFSQGDILYGTGASTTATLPKDTNATRYLSNTGTSNNPAWSLINLVSGVSGILSSANGGTGNASTSFTGQTLGRTYTLPDANTTILTTNSLISVAQGGTGTSTFATGFLTKIQNNTSLAALIVDATYGCVINCPVMSTTSSNGVSPVSYDFFSNGANTVKGVSYPKDFSGVNSNYVSTVLGLVPGSPQKMVFDFSGNIYVANSSTNNVTKITPAGVSSTLGATGSGPQGITIDSTGNIYTANSNSSNVTKITPAGVSSTLGTTGTNPFDITIDSAGNIYTANYNVNNVTKITPAGASSTLGATGSGPQGITIDSTGNIYTANSSSNNVTKITPAGVSSTLGTTGSSPQSITIDSTGNIYTANTSSNNVTKITPAGATSTLATTGTSPADITIDSLGNLYTKNNTDVTKITPAGASSTILISGGSVPHKIAVDSSGDIYLSGINADITKLSKQHSGYLLSHGSTTVSIEEPTVDKVNRSMYLYANNGAATVTNTGFPAAPTLDGTLTASSTINAPFIMHSGNVSGTAVGVISPLFSYVWRDWNPTFSTYVLTDSAATSTNRVWVGLFSADPGASGVPNIHAAAFRYDSGIDGTAFWRTVTIAGTGASATVTTTSIPFTKDTYYAMNIYCTSSACSFYINGTLVATHTTTLPSLGTSMGYAVRMTPLAAVTRAVGWSRLSITHK